jgi:hypothetical protein
LKTLLVDSAPQQIIINCIYLYSRYFPNSPLMGRCQTSNDEINQDNCRNEDIYDV